MKRKLQEIDQHNLLQRILQEQQEHQEHLLSNQLINYMKYKRCGELF